MTEKDGLKLISADEVPPMRRGGPKRGKWAKIFSQIPEGKALVLAKDEVSIQSLRQALKRHQDRGEFKHLEIALRGDTIYVIARGSST